MPGSSAMLSEVVSLLVFFIIISTIESSLTGFTDKNCGDFKGEAQDKQAFSKDFCRSLALQKDTNKCCYVRRKNNDATYYNCIELTIEEFYNMDAAKSKAASELGGDIKSLVCDSSSYLYSSLFLLLIALL